MAHDLAICQIHAWLRCCQQKPVWHSVVYKPDSRLFTISPRRSSSVKSLLISSSSPTLEIAWPSEAYFDGVEQSSEKELFALSQPCILPQTTVKYRLALSKPVNPFLFHLVLETAAPGFPKNRVLHKVNLKSNDMTQNEAMLCH